jgi:hypothetical protein
LCDFPVMRLRLIALFTAALVVAGGATNASLAAGPPSKPTIRRTHAYGIEGSEAVLLGSIDPRGLETNWYFQLGTTKAYGLSLARTSLEEPIGGDGAQGVEEGVDCLAPKTRYHFRIAAKNGAGTSYGHDQTFKTKRLKGSPKFIYAECPAHRPLR